MNRTSIDTLPTNFSTNWPPRTPKRSRSRIGRRGIFPRALGKIAMDFLCKEDASRSRKFTVCHGTEEVGAFDTPADVIDFVLRRLDRTGYTIYLGAGVTLNSKEARLIGEKWTHRSDQPYPNYSMR